MAGLYLAGMPAVRLVPTEAGMILHSSCRLERGLLVAATFLSEVEYVGGGLQLGTEELIRLERAPVASEFHFFDEVLERQLRLGAVAGLAELGMNRDFILALIFRAAFVQGGEFHRRGSHAQV